MTAVVDLANRYANPEIDRSRDQVELDLVRRSRTSLFPWRGQFSPELVALMLRDLPGDGLIVDPFVGSGTTLFEASRVGQPAFGAEINPAALCFARLSELASVPVEDRLKLVARCQRLLSSHAPGVASEGLFAADAFDGDGAIVAKQILNDLADDDAASAVFRAALVLAMGQKPGVDLGRVARELERLRETLVAVPVGRSSCQAGAADARALPLGDGQAGAVITSPPYINVFNYHQQYRPAVELLGGAPLGVARAEIGANRKHRQNRFLTVIQYALDMSAVLCEMHRVLRAGGVAKVVIGRESNVRKVPFRNAQLLAMLSDGLGVFDLTRWQERRFTTRFGESIFEDILTLQRKASPQPAVGFTARAAGVWALEQAASQKGPLPEDVSHDLASAISSGDTVRPSPLFDPSSIPWA